jgi:hypothetical protein
MIGSRVSFRLEGETRRFGRIVRVLDGKYEVGTAHGREFVPSRLITHEEI